MPGTSLLPARPGITHPAAAARRSNEAVVSCHVRLRDHETSYVADDVFGI